MGKWRAAKDKGVFLLDITAKTGRPAFAPDFGDVMRYKRGELSEQEYTKIYLDRMEESKLVLPRSWQSLNKRSEIALGCYCKAGVFCHRHLFKEIMQVHLEAQGFTVIQEGELEDE